MALLAAVEIGQRAKASKRAGIPMERLGAAEWVQVFDLFTDGRIPREAIQPVAAQMAKNPGVDAAAASATLGYALQDRAAWTREIEGLCSSPESVPLLRRSSAGEPSAALLASKQWHTTADSDGKRLRYLIGKAVRQLRGRAPAKDVAEFVKARLGQEVLQ